MVEKLDPGGGPDRAFLMAGFFSFFSAFSLAAHPVSEQFALPMPAFGPPFDSFRRFLTHSPQCAMK
jgi:hypothetical protein